MEIKNKVRIRSIIWPPDRGLTNPLVICEGDDRVPFFTCRMVSSEGKLYGNVPSHTMWEEGKSPTVIEGDAITLIPEPNRFGIYYLSPLPYWKDEGYEEPTEGQINEFIQWGGGLR